jgi:hypothetical protein
VIAGSRRGKNNNGGTMFTVKKVGNNRVDIEISDKLDSEEMKQALDELVDQSKDLENGLMLYDIIDFKMPSMGALAIEFSRLPALFGLIKKYQRIAVLSDTNWIKKASELEGMLIPGLEIKAFDRNQRKEAEAWLSG